MTVDTLTEFFDRLSAQRHEPLLSALSGTIRFDLSSGASTDHWYVRVNKVKVSVAREERAADAVVRADRDAFAAMTEGRVNAVTAFLRGELAVDGDVGLVISFQRLFPGPPASRSAS